MTVDALLILLVLFGCLILLQTERHHREQKRSEELRTILNDLMVKISEDPQLKFVTEAYYQRVREAGRACPRPVPLPPAEGDRP